MPEGGSYRPVGVGPVLVRWVQDDVLAGTIEVRVKV
jgi:hypothetical protein